MDEIIMTISLLILIETTYLAIKKYRQRQLKVARGSLLLDSSCLMDGRILDVARSGLVTAEIIIPKSVIEEMQLVADKSDSQKRARARLGLDHAKALQKLPGVSVAVVDDGALTRGGVDRRLLDLATKYNASIATNDFNLNKVAKVQDITVINLNELAQLLRSQLLPGEKVEIRVVQVGNSKEQGVGYLDDGTMVVVDRAAKNLGKKIRVEITRSLQTEAGRMMFASKTR